MSAERYWCIFHNSKEVFVLSKWVGSSNAKHEFEFIEDFAYNRFGNRVAVTWCSPYIV